ncbi:MAG: malto-oligosyltrehalose synthase, partial [Gemmatimonadota bacterium]
MTRQAATYRLQLEPGFDLHEARRLVPYLARLGITHVYLSPVLEARAGSTHGYDVTDPGRVRAELGGMAAFVALADTAAEHGLTLLLDIVPNHMAASEENPAWRDVLRLGAASPYARWFDLSWHTGPEPFPIPLPVLGAPLEDVLAAGELALAAEDGSVVVTYFDRRFPCSPEGCAFLARTTGMHTGAPGNIAADAETTVMASAPTTADAASAADPASMARAPAPAETASAPDPAAAAELVARFDALADTERTHVLRELLDLQHYAIRFWRSCAGVVGYRRFFDIDDLVSVRVEDPGVFDAVHAGLDRCLAHPAVAGVRVDHVDGLLDPVGYLRRLRALLDRRRPDAWLLVEKILAPDEALPADWPVDGTTGYEFLVTLNGLLVPEAGGRSLQALHGRLTGMRVEPTDMALARKRQVLERIFSGELDLLARELTALREGVPVPAADPALRAALAETSVRMEVYRTYVRGPGPSPTDRRRIEAALAAAEQALAGQSAAGTLPFLRAVLLLDAEVLDRRLRPALAFVQRWQQLTGPLMAKGYEDTALYRYSALAAGSDVGAELDRPWTPAAEVHAFLAGRAAAPRTLNTTSTHDTKRSEDVRARLDVLAELADDWAAAVGGWTRAIEGW